MIFYLLWILSSLVLLVHCQDCKISGCPVGLCCSEYGYCGDTPEHCKGTTPKPTINATVTLRTGDCRICGCSTSSDCCSHYGFCGDTPDHCAKLTVILPESNLISQTRVGDCRICQNCEKTKICCPNTGYCVDKCDETSSPIPNKYSCQPNPMKFYKIYHTENKKYLDYQQFSTNPNIPTITQWPESNTLNQLWQFKLINQSSNIYLIISVKNTKALTVTSSRFIQQWSYDTDNYNQYFQIELKNNLCQIINLQTNQSLIIKDKSTDAPLQIDKQQADLWKLIEVNTSSESVKNRNWNVFINEICVDDEKQTSENKLTLTDCLYWCNADQGTKFCMWNFNNEDDELGFCISVNQCKKRTSIKNEKYRTYIYKTNVDLLSSKADDELSIGQTASLTNYIDYTKYLLLEANDFDFPVEPLQCTDLIPGNEIILTFESSNDGIRLCDLCPNLPSFDKYPDYFIRSIPLIKTSNITFDECFVLCVEDIQCIGYSYNQQNSTCLTFKQTSITGIDGLVYQEQWITILIKQPIGIIQNWLYTRHTKIALQIDEENIPANKTETFLECLNICSHSHITCLAITYDFQTKECHLFENITTNNWIQLSYGSISAFHFLHIYKNDSNQWRFQIQDQEKIIPIQQDSPSLKPKKTCTLPNQTLSTEYEIYYNPNCLISGGNGCNRLTGCQLCLKFKANFEKNLPLCPSLLSNIRQDEQEETEIENCMTICLNQSTTCIGFDYDSITSICSYIKTYSNWSINENTDFKRYLLSYPPKPYEFIPNCQLISSTTIFESKNLEECLKICQSSSCQKVSYNYNTLKCQTDNYRAGILRINSDKNSHCFIRNFLGNNDLTSIRMAFYRSIGYQIIDQSYENVLFQCKSDCSNEIDQCLTNCLNSSECQYISLTYEKTNSFSCKLFRNEINETKDFVLNDFSEIYYRYFNINLNQETINNMTLFQIDSDLAKCYDQTRTTTTNKYDQTYSTLKGFKNVLDNDLIKLRQRRFLGFIKKAFKKAVNWVGKNIVKPVVDTVVDIVKTPIQIGKAIGAAIQGDGEKAKKELLNIGIVKDAINFGENAVEFGKALGKGDLKGAGKSLLNLAGDAVGFVPLPVGRIAGKVGSNVMKKGLKNTKKQAKPKSHDRKKKDNKKSKDDIDEICAKRTKRNAKRKRCDADKDDKKSGGPKCRRPSIKHTLSIDNCHMKSVGTKCDWECDIGYIESDENGVRCRKKNDKNAFWQPKPDCEIQKCGTGNYPLIFVETNKKVAYTIYFDKKRKLPIWSFSIHDTTNNVMKGLKAGRAGSFYLHPCPQLKNYQGTKEHYRLSKWDRGHLTPSDAHRYSKKASKSSNLFINVAPQDPWTNQVPWSIIEAHVLCHNNKYPASLVVTGICPNSIGKTKSFNGLDIPSCFWKMICYMRNGVTHVVGFLAENKRISSLNKKDTEAARSKIFEPVSQGKIRDRLRSDSHYLRNPFERFVYSKSNKGRTPTMVQPELCARAMSLDSTEAAAWRDDFLNVKKKKTKRALPSHNARGCTPEEARAMAIFMGLNSLDINDNDNGVKNDDDTDDDDDDNDDKDNNDDKDDGNDDDDDGDDDDDDGGNDGRPVAATCGKRIIGYYPSWGKDKISGKHIRHLTHIVYAFFEVDSSGQVFVGSADRTHSKDIQQDIDVAKKRLQHLLKLKKTYSQQKYLFAVGGWENSQYFSSIAQSPEKRLRFIGSSLKLLDEYDLDGIDIDWEHPVTGGAVEGIVQDKQNYVLFMKEIRQSLDQHGGGEKKYLLSFASAAGQWTLDPGYDLPSLLEYADFVNIMSYDFFGAWESKWGAYTGPPAPLYFGMPPRFSGKTNVDWTVKYYMCRTNQPHKINMGVPFYGRFWKNVPRESIDPSDGMWRKANAVNGKFEGGFASWNEIKTSWLTNPAYQQQNHPKTKSSYAYNEAEGTFLGFESPQSLKDKVAYASEKNVGGLMIWAIDQDDDDLTMMNIVSNAPLCQKTDPKGIFFKCSPLKGEKRWWTLEDSEEKAGMCGRSAPLYKSYYPVCDPDDPGYSCCSPQGYCGFSDKHCKGQGVNYGENPDLLVEEPVRPSVGEVRWFLLDAPDGQRGRCGREAPKLPNGEFAICNPDDKNGHCCSNGGYCGSGKEFCDCEGCIDFKKQSNYRFKPKNWRDDGKCGEKAEKINNEIAICNPDSKTAYCCSASGYCGSGAEFCDCKECVNHKGKNK